MKKLSKIIAVVLAAITIAVCFAACAPKEGANNNEGTDKKTLTLATSADFPPYEFMEGEEFKGIDIEIAQAIADKLGYELVIDNMDFDSVITSVSTNKADIGMSGITVTEDRKQSVDFSTPYATGVQVVIVPAGSPIKTVDDLYADGASYKVGVQLSTTGDIYFSDDIAKGTTTCSVEEFTVATDAILALTSGKIDAVIIDNEPAKNFVKANDGLQILDTEYIVEDYAIALAKGSELKDDVNSAIEALIADGTVKTIVDKYIPAE